MTITITTSNVNGIRAAKRKGIEEWAGRNTPDVWCMQEVRAPQNEIDPIFDEFGFEYSTAGRISDQSELHRMNEICRIKGRAGVGLLSALPVVDKRYGLPGLEDDVDSGRWIEADMQTPQGYVITVVCVYVHAGNTDDPEKMKQKYRFLDTMLIRMEQLRDEAAHGGNKRCSAVISTSRTRRSTSKTPKPTKRMPDSSPRSAHMSTNGWENWSLWM